MAFNPQQFFAGAIVPAVSFLGGSADVVAVLNSGFDPVLVGSSPMKAEVMPRAKLMDHPLESGQLVTDYKIILPLELRLPILIPYPFYRDIYQEILNLWRSSELLTVQTKAASYSNLVIVEPPHEENPDMFDAIIVNLRFREVQVVDSSGQFAPADPTQSDTVGSGQQQPITGPDATASSSAINVDPVAQFKEGAPLISSGGITTQAPISSGAVTLYGKAAAGGP